MLISTKRLLLASALLGALTLPVLAADNPPGGAAPAAAPSTAPMPPKKMAWSFDGPFGVYDRASLQRGFQVYKEVCSACHSLDRIAFRNLAEKGGPEFSETQVAAIAASYKVPADPDEQGKTVASR